jgi:selenocysteine lyase/cysteine desulfurase
MSSVDPAPLDTAARERLSAAQAEFDAEVAYLDTATMGLPPRRTVRAVQDALVRWQHGTDDARAYDDEVEHSRRAYARLVGVAPSWVAVGAQVSAYVGLVATSLRPGSEVLTVEGDFTSVLFPFLAQATRQVSVREVPLDHLVDAVTPSTSLVAVSAVQSADGRCADLAGLAAACDATGTRTLVDTTQAAGWLPIDAGRFSYTTGAGYKWLLAPRGTAFLTVRPEHLDDLVPVGAGWYAGEDRWTSIYGSPLRLATDARRFDLSPAWHAWAGQRTSLDLLLEVGAPTLHAHAVGLADHLRRSLGLAPAGSAIVSLSTTEDAPAALAQAGVAAAGRAGRLRLGCHVSTTVEDVDRAVEVLRERVLRG